MIRIESDGPGQYRFERDWQTGVGLHFELTLVDTDGDIGTRTAEWIADKPYNVRDAMPLIIKVIDDQPHWRARVTGKAEITIGPTNPNHEFSIEVTPING